MLQIAIANLASAATKKRQADFLGCFFLNRRAISSAQGAAFFSCAHGEANENTNSPAARATSSQPWLVLIQLVFPIEDISFRKFRHSEAQILQNHLCIKVVTGWHAVKPVFGRGRILFFSPEFIA